MRADFHRHFVERSYYSEVLSFLLFLVTVPEVLVKVTLFGPIFFSFLKWRIYETYAPFMWRKGVSRKRVNLPADSNCLQ